MNRRSLWMVSVLTGLLMSTGCGGSSASKPEGRVSGTVTAAGQPLANVMVNFQDPKTGSAGIATTDAVGKYQINGSLVAGTFKVYFSPVVAPPGAPGTPPPVITPLTIPDKYKTLETTDLVKEVKAGSNVIPLEAN